MTKRTAKYMMAILILLIGIVGCVYYIYRKIQMEGDSQIQPYTISLPKGSINSILTPFIKGWNVYVNTAYGYAIDYPANFVANENDFPYKNGAGFRPVNSSATMDSEVIHISETGRAIDYCSFPFLDYVKTIGVQDMLNVDTPNSFASVETESGLLGYTTTWITHHNLDSRKDNSTPTLPMTYFEDKSQLCSNETGMVKVDLNNKNYLLIYNQMLSTFRFI